jgi:DeoR family glycerol-3-phosphate regulon repressor
MVEVGRLDQVDRLFTDQAPPTVFDALLAEAGVACTVVGGGHDNGDSSDNGDSA